MDRPFKRSASSNGNNAMRDYQYKNDVRERHIKLIKYQSDVAPFIPTIREISDLWGLSSTATHDVLQRMVKHGLAITKDGKYFAISNEHHHEIHGLEVEMSISYTLLKSDATAMKQDFHNGIVCVVEGFYGYYQMVDVEIIDNGKSAFDVGVLVTLKRVRHVNLEDNSRVRYFEVGRIQYER